MRKNSFVEISVYVEGSRQDTVVISHEAFLQAVLLQTDGYIKRKKGLGALRKLQKMVDTLLEEARSAD